MPDALADGGGPYPPLVTQHGGHWHLVYFSAAVETVSRYVKGNADGLPLTENPVFAEAQARTEEFACGGQICVDPRTGGWLPDACIDMGSPPRTSPSSWGLTREEQDTFGVSSGIGGGAMR